MASSGILRRVALIRTDVLKEPSASIIIVRRIAVQGTMLARASVSSWDQGCLYFTDSFHPIVAGARFHRNVDSYKSHTA
jgi:hypothetical protein